MEKDLTVTYWNEKLSETSEEDYQKEYLVISTSPKIEAWTERNFQLKTGIGTDGVEIIQGSIGE